jgi:glycosyltransferase involved in cell wall biosynthesis
LRILFLSSLSADYALLTGRVLPVARALIQAGHQAQVLTLHHDWAGRPEKELVYWGVPIRYVGPMHVQGLGDSRRQLARGELIRAAVSGTVGLTRAALAHPADLYHVWKPHPFNGIAGLLAARIRRRPLFIDCDDYETASSRYTGRWQKGIVRWFEHSLPRRAAGVTVNTRFWQDRLVNTLRFPAERVAYVPNGMDESRFGQLDAAAAERLRGRLGLTGKATVVYVGILSLTGHPLDLLLEAFRRVVRVLPQAHLVLVGGGEDGPALRRQVQHMAMGQHVTFTGVVPPEDVAPYYLLGDCSVDPVRDDLHGRARCPLKVLESSACGVPVITGDVGDRRELLEDGRAGLLVQPGDADALAEGIRSLLSDREKRLRMGRRARQHAQGYRWEKLAQELLQFYERNQKR